MPLTPQQLADFQRLRQSYAPVLEAQRRKQQAQANLEKMHGLPPAKPQPKAGGGLTNSTEYKSIDEMLAGPVKQNSATKTIQNFGHRMIESALPLRKMIRTGAEPMLNEWYRRSVMADPEASLEHQNIASDDMHSTLFHIKNALRNKLGLPRFPDDVEIKIILDMIPNSLPDKSPQRKADGGSVEPKKTVKAYKLFRVHPNHPGKLFPLFVDANTPVEMNKWTDAKEGEMANGKVKSKIGALAYRPGWHAGDLPIATHIGEKSDPKLTAPDRRPANHAWAEVEMPDDVDWQSEATKRGTNAQGKVIPVKSHITDQIPKGGHYRYKTNPNMIGNWLIGGSMKVNKVLTDAEVKAINKAAGMADLPRAQPFKKKTFGFAGGGCVGPQEWMAEEHVNHKAKGGSIEANKQMIEDVYGKYPVHPFNPNQRAMIEGEGENQTLGTFELKPSMSARNAVELDWLSAYPHKQGVGSRTLKALQGHATEHGVGMTLFPWEHGGVSQSKLMKFYKKHGFVPTTKGGKAMIWRPKDKAHGGRVTHAHHLEIEERPL